VAGRAAERRVTTGTSYRFMIQKEDGQTVAIVQSNELGFRPGDRVVIVRGRTTRLERAL